jgi:hypothetical protein
VESIVVLQDKGAEEGMNKTYEDHFARQNEPKFIPPPPEEVEVVAQDPQANYPFYGPPSVQTPKVVTTYVDPDYIPPPPCFQYPESVAGLPERSQPLMLFLICKSPVVEDDPLYYLQNIMKKMATEYKVKATF